MCKAQDTVDDDSIEVIAVEKVTINNWDGSYKSPNMPLYIGVDEYKILNLTIEPEDADIETIHLAIVMEEGDAENSPIAFWGMEVGAFWAATRTLKIYNADYTQTLATTQITAYDTSGGLDNDTTTTWTVETDYETEDVVLTLTNTSESEEPGFIPDRADGVTYPWDELASTITKLEIDGDYSYIGSGVFDQLYNLEKIQFNSCQSDAYYSPRRSAPAKRKGTSVESIHYLAFCEWMHPWKFAFGDPQDGPVVPPQVIFDDVDQQQALEVWRHIFSEETVLYVPDSVINYHGREIRSVDLYRSSFMWGNAFNRIDDHTVGIAEVTDTSTIFTWMPQEKALAYILTIHKEGCDDCDTTITIEADGDRGLIGQSEEDQTFHISRAPKSDDGSGGMTLTIKIGGGGIHTQEVTAEVSGMAAETDYSYNRTVMTQDGVSDALTKAGTVETLPEGEGIEEIWVSGEMRVYDLLGRPMGTSIEDLPMGIYILDNGTKRITIMIGK